MWQVQPQLSTNTEEGGKALDLICADGLYQDAGYPLGQEEDGRFGADNLDFWAHDAAYAQAHAGNQGDSTDLFDGVRFRRFELGSNPSNHVRDLVAGASSGVELTLERQGKSMQLDVRQPRWAGTIDGAATWYNTVLVEGDVRVAPQAELTIIPGTQVLFAGADRLHSGQDPTRCELGIEGDIVVWLGNSMDQKTQATFRNYLEGGGNLLAASFNFSKSPGIGDFLGELLHVTAVGEIAKTALHFQPDGRGAPLMPPVHRVLEVGGAAEPVLFGEGGQVAGVRVADIYKAVYLPFDLKDLDGEAQHVLLENQLAFLQSEKAARLKLLLGAEPQRQIMRLQAWIPQVTVANGGNGDSQPFRIAYQVVRDGQVIASAGRDETPLQGQSRRVIEFPAWMPPLEGGYDVFFGMSTEAGDGLVYQPGQHFDFAQAPPPFVEVELPGEIDKGNGAGFFDYDGDGDLDLLLVRRQAPSRLLRNDGSGFSEQTQAAGLRSTALDRGLAFGDYDGDGDLDLYLVSEAANLFFNNEGDGTFVEVTDQVVNAVTGTSLADEGSGRSAGFFDGDGDGDLDLYVVNAGGVNPFYSNEGGRYSERAAAVGLADEGNGRGLALGDFDGDGAVDVFVANTAGGSRLLRSEGLGFVAVEEEFGLNFNGGEVAAAFGDVDGDGGVDLLVAKVEVVAGGRRWVREMQSGYGYASQVQPRLHFGLGAAAWVDTLRVVWPDGWEQALTQVAAGQRLKVEYVDAPTKVLSVVAVLPGEMRLWQNYPNPFNSSTMIRFAVPQAGQVELAIFNLTGQRLAVREVEALQAGVYEVHWDGRDDNGHAVASGLYIYQLQVGTQTERRKLLLLC